MAKLSEIIKQEYKTKGAVSGLSSAVAKRLREKVDLRNLFFGGSGVGSQIGRKLFGRGYSAISDKPDLASKVKPVGETDTLNFQLLNDILKSTSITAKNSVVFPYMARDINLVKLNIMRLVKVLGGKSTRGTDMFFKDAKDRENIYESQFNRQKGFAGKSPSLIGGAAGTGAGGAGGEDGEKGVINNIVDRVATLLGLKSVLDFAKGKQSVGKAGLLKKILPRVLGGGLVTAGVAAAAIGIPTLIALKRTDEQGDTIANKALSGGALGQNDASSIMEANGDKSPEQIREQQRVQKEALADAPFLTRVYGYKKKEYLAKKGLTPEGSPMALTGENYEAMAVDLIRREEGLPKNGKAYKDAHGYSIGYGHFITPAEQAQGFIQAGDERVPISPNITDTQITKDQAEKLLMMDLPKYVSAAQAPLGEAWDKLNDQQKATLVSSAYNTGQGGVEYMVKKGLKTAIMSGNIEEASKIIKEHGFQKSRTSKESAPVTNPVLVARRAREAELFAGGEIPTPSTALAAKPALQAPTPKMPASTIQTASTNVSDERMSASKSETPVLLNAPVTNNNVNNGGGNQARGYDTAKSKVYDSDLSNLLIRLG